MGAVVLLLTFAPAGERAMEPRFEGWASSEDPPADPRPEG